MRVFLAEPEGGLPADVRSAIFAALEPGGHEILAPPPTWHAGVSASERNRFLTVVDRMMEADMLVADASTASQDVGWCVAWFLARGRLVVLTCRRDARATLAPMLAGNPSPWQRLVLYDDAGTLARGLTDALLA